MNTRVHFISSNSIVFILATLLCIAEVHCYMNNKTASMCCNNFDYTKTGMVANCGTPTDDKMKGMQRSCSSACVSYQCIDWTIGSSANAVREASFFQRTGQQVYFGVGSYGNNVSRAGQCYRISVTNVYKDILVQVVNQGFDVSEGNFDLMVADGGFGLFDACADGPEPMYNSTKSAWGNQYGGVSTIAGCNQLPQYPVCQYNKPQDDLRDLCKFSFTAGIRATAGYSNPRIQKMCQVACPMELFTSTGLRRSDEKPTGYTCSATSHMEKSGGSLTRMMDCAKPSYGWATNIKNGTTYPGYSAVVPCRRDGYTRINQLAGRPTYFPTMIPSARPTTGKPSVPPTIEPTEEPTYFQTEPPTEEPSFAPTYEFPPSAVPTVSPSTYNFSLAGHKLSVVRLDSSITIDHVIFGSTSTFDALAQKVLCTTIDEIIGTAIGSTRVSQDSTTTISMIAFKSKNEFRVEAPKPNPIPITTGYRVVIVKVTTIVTALPPTYLPYLVSQTQAAIAVGQTLLRAINDLSMNARLRKNANRMGATSLATANVTQANITFVPLSQQADSSVSMSSMDKVSASAVIGVVLGVLVGTFMLLVCASAYFKFVENEKKELIYKMSSKESADNLLEVGTVIENADGTPSRRDEIRTPIPVPSPRQHPKPFPGTMSVSVTPSAPVSPPSPSKLATLQRSASSTGSLSGLSDYRGRYEREILNNSNKSSSRREIIHVPGETLDDGEIIFFYDDKNKGSHDPTGIRRNASSNTINSKLSRSNLTSPSGDFK